MQTKKPPLKLQEKARVVAAKVAIDNQSPFGNRRASFFERLTWQACDWHVFPQHWRQKLRKRFARKIVGPFDVELMGMNFRLYPAENYCDRVIFGRKDLPERVEHEALLPLLNPGMVFVDIGANVGSYSAFVGKNAGGDVTLFALEPHPRTYQKLLFNLQANGLPTNHVLNCGAGPVRSELELWSDGGSNIGHTSMLKEGTANPKVSVKVPVVPFYDLLNEQGISHIDLLKIDIEGFEDRALAPFFDVAAEALLPNHILIEVAHQILWERDLLAMIKDRDYTEIFRTPENILLSRN